MTQLECQHCKGTFIIEDWNEGLLYKDKIPVDIQPEDWSEYAEEHNNIVLDCPDCGESNIFVDMDAY